MTKHDITEPLTHLLAAILPGFQFVDNAARLTQGASRAMHRIDVTTEDGTNTYAMRRASSEQKGHAGQITLESEAALILAAHQSGIPAPGILCSFAAHHPANNGLGDGYIMDWVEGETLGGRIAHSKKFAEARQHMAAQSGDILGRIHAIDIKAAGLEPILQHRTASELIEETLGDYLKLGVSVPMLDYAAAWLKQNLPSSTDAAFTHGDFRNGNIIVDATGIVSVLDWELACISDPMRDLAWLCLNSWRFGSDLPVGGFGRKEDLFTSYEAASGRRVDEKRFHFWSVYGSFWWGVLCLTFAHSYRSGENTHIDRLAIGRRSSEAQIDLVNLLIPGEILEDVKALPDIAPNTETLSSLDELISSLQNTLAGSIASKLEGPVKFEALVAASNAGVILREVQLGAAATEIEDALLAKFLPATQRTPKALCAKIRVGDIALTHKDLQTYLRNSTAAQVMIDQPTYSGLKAALEYKGS